MSSVNSIAEKIITHSRREAAKKFTYLEKAIFHHKTKAASNVKLMGADYSTLFYNPEDIINMYEINPLNIEKAIIHCILHCMLLHPSFEEQNSHEFSVAADSIVNAMLENSYPCNSDNFKRILNNYNTSTTTGLLKLILSNKRLAKQLSRLYLKHKNDDHSVWHKSGNQDNENQQENSDSDRNENQNNSNNKKNSLTSDDKQNNSQKNFKLSGSEADQDTKNKAAWHEMFVNVSCTYGNQSGNLFFRITPPDRFSKFSYLEYIKRFAVEEIVEDDPETFDMILYTAGMEMYEDIAIVEWNEIRENINPSDIIIAIDMSGSCDGDIALNFLRQIYTLFDEINIRSSMNIHVLFFDTEILMKKIIRTREDAEKLIKEYEARGFGGTSFECVFEYADKFQETSHGRKLKGLFFFSDADGCFPKDKKTYRTTFFVPDTQYSEYQSYDYVPDWIELVHYNDN